MTIIKVENLGKKYVIGHQKPERYLALRDVLTDGAKRLFNFGRRNASLDDTKEDFWALKEVSFEIKEGERLGIIGRNGAGKSTLLKVLSRITEPTVGRISIKGRVASLLEVGTGFHPELTGRENIFLNGAVLGMRRREIMRKFDEIVAFSEVERFLDTPVKRYSSGMYVRLAFAVAAHLEPEILVVDEVLAVGDLQFQQKCLGKMENVSREGRTVLFVSHNMEAIQRLCSRSVLLSGGKIVSDGPTPEVIHKYMQIGPSETGEKLWSELKSAPGDEAVRLRSVRIKDRTGKVATSFDVRDPIYIELAYQVLQDWHMLDAELFLTNDKGHAILFSMDNNDSPWTGKDRPPGLYHSTCQVPGDFLNEGHIFVTAAVSTNPYNCHAVARDVLRFDVKDSLDPEGVRGNFSGTWSDSAVRPRLLWKTIKEEK